MFQNQCLGELAYESTAAAILMAGIFISFLVEYAGSRLVQWHEDKKRPENVESAGHAHSPSASRTDMVNITVLEAGVIFHSLCKRAPNHAHDQPPTNHPLVIGLTLVVAGDSFFLTLFAVIVFHQMFEGVALGTRIAALGQACPTSTPVVDDGHGGHVHEHGHEHYHNHDHDHTPAPAVLTPETSDESKQSPSAEDSSASTTDSHTHGAVSNHVSMRKKLLLALAFALVTPLGMAIGIGALHQFNGNDPATIIAIGTLDALSAGILVWVGVVEMWAHDWMLGGEMTRASPIRTVLGLVALVAGMAVMSLLGKWA
jgi:zinc transporter 1/2/3